MEENQKAQKLIPGPPQLPPLYKGQKIKTVSNKNYIHSYIYLFINDVIFIRDHTLLQLQMKW